MNCGLHRISSNVERIVRPGLKPPRGACPGHVRLSAVSNPQSCREMLNHWSRPTSGGARIRALLERQETQRGGLQIHVLAPPRGGKGLSPVSLQASGILPVRRLNPPPWVVLAPAADSSRSRRLNPLGPRVFTVGSVHKWRHRLRCVSTVPALHRDFRAPNYEGSVCISCCHCTLTNVTLAALPSCCWRPRPLGPSGLTQRRTPCKLIRKPPPSNWIDFRLTTHLLYTA